MKLQTGSVSSHWPSLKLGQNTTEEARGEIKKVKVLILLLVLSGHVCLLSLFWFCVDPRTLPVDPRHQNREHNTRAKASIVILNEGSV